MNSSGPTLPPDGACYAVAFKGRVYPLRFGGVLASHMSILSPRAVSGDTEAFPDSFPERFTLGVGLAC